MQEQSCLVPVGPQVRHYAERMDATLSPEQDSFGIIRLLWFCRVFGCSRTRLALIDSGDYRRRRVPLHCFTSEPLRLRSLWLRLGSERADPNRPLSPVAWSLCPLAGQGV